MTMVTLWIFASSFSFWTHHISPYNTWNMHDHLYRILSLYQTTFHLLHKSLVYATSPPSLLVYATLKSMNAPFSYCLVFSWHSFNYHSHINDLITTAFSLQPFGFSFKARVPILALCLHQAALVSVWSRGSSKNLVYRIIKKKKKRNLVVSFTILLSSPPLLFLLHHDWNSLRWAW